MPIVTSEQYKNQTTLTMISTIFKTRSRTKLLAKSKQLKTWVTHCQMIKMEMRFQIRIIHQV